MRFFLGLTEICNITTAYAKALRILGHETLTAVTRKNSYYRDSQYDTVLHDGGKTKYFQSLIHWLPLFSKAIMECDVFIFTHTTLLPYFMDVHLLKRLEKKIIFTFWGSDVRSIGAFEQQMNAMGTIEEYKPFITGVRQGGKEPIKRKKLLVRLAERYADLILSQPGYAQLQTRPYMRANIPLDISNYMYTFTERKFPVILHAPSNPLIKGTSFILQTIEELKTEGLQFDFHFIQNMPNRELRNIMSTSDIIVDGLYSDTVGVLSTEGMATGNVVMTHFPAELAGVPDDCPAVNITEKTLKEHLRRAIVDISWRRHLSMLGREFVENYYDHVKVTRQLINSLENVQSLKYDFIPDFYKYLI